MRQTVGSFAGNPSSNAGIDYTQLFEAAVAMRRAVDALYAHAGLDVARDLGRSMTHRG